LAQTVHPAVQKFYFLALIIPETIRILVQFAITNQILWFQILIIYLGYIISDKAPKYAVGIFVIATIILSNLIFAYNRFPLLYDIRIPLTFYLFCSFAINHENITKIKPT